MGRKRASGVSLPWWAWGALGALASLALLNGAVAWLGDTHVFPLSPSFLGDKARALGTYLAHRPTCLVSGHPPLEPLISAAERRHHLPPGLLHALIQVESEARVHRISPTGAMGPGQLMPGTARMLRVGDPFDPEPAIDGSARYLAQQLARFDDVRLAVAAYNAGPGAVKGRVPHNGETEFYVARVLAAYAHQRPPSRSSDSPRPPEPKRPLAAPAKAPGGDRRTVASRPVTPARQGLAARPGPLKPAPGARPAPKAKKQAPPAPPRPEAQARR